jgi:hypothetical protein
MGREALRIGGNIITNIAANKSPDVEARDIVGKRLGESAHNIVRKMRGGEGKRKRACTLRKTQSKRGSTPRKKVELIKRDIFAQ